MFNLSGSSQARHHATATSKIKTHVPMKIDDNICDRLRERIKETRKVTIVWEADFVLQSTPDLVALCENHGVNLIFVDLRWSITPTISEGQWTVKTCLDAVCESDIFIGFYAQRYGASKLDGKSRDWLLPSLKLCYEKCPWLERHLPVVEDMTTTAKSITHMEFECGYTEPGIDGLNELLDRHTVSGAS